MMLLLIGFAAAVAAQPVPVRTAIDPVLGPRQAPMSGPMTGPMTGPRSGPMTGPRTGPMTRAKPAQNGADMPVGVVRGRDRSADATLMVARNGQWWLGNRRATKAEIIGFRRSR